MSQQGQRSASEPVRFSRVLGLRSIVALGLGGFAISLAAKETITNIIANA